jgi:hypothetical protein
MLTCHFLFSRLVFIEPNTVELEYDSLLGNFKSTRNRSSTITTNLDHDLPPIESRSRSTRNRSSNLPLESSSHDQTPIWARRRTSHSTVKPSDLIREYDKREKLDGNALRRLSRAGIMSRVNSQQRFYQVEFIVVSI